MALFLFSFASSQKKTYTGEWCPYYSGVFNNQKIITLVARPGRGWPNIGAVVLWPLTAAAEVAAVTGPPLVEPQSDQADLFPTPVPGGGTIL